jgi:acyl-CoA synthetase (AMP-forming)/AMP-acid ligase II
MYRPEESGAGPGVVDDPPPDELVPAVHARLTGAVRRPLAVLDSRWPASLRRRAAADLTDAVVAGHLEADDLVLFTSGSSGSPRAVVRSVESWRASLEPLSDITAIGLPDGEPGVVWIAGPLTSSLFLYGAVHAAWCGLAWVRGRPDARAVQDVTAAHLVPTQLADALDARDRGLLTRLRTVVVAGASLAPSLRERTVAHGVRVIEYYGAAELSFCGWSDDGGALRPFPGVETHVADDSLLWVRSPYVARAYLRPESTGPWQQRDGWHSVGDLARSAPRGWHLLGRGDAAVVTGGHTVVVEEVEAALRDVHGVADVVVLGLPHERLGAVVTAVVLPTSRDDPALPGRLQQAAHALPSPARPRRWLRADDVPRLPSGKVDRAAVREAAPTLPPL